MHLIGSRGPRLKGYTNSQTCPLPVKRELLTLALLENIKLFLVNPEEYPRRHIIPLTLYEFPNLSTPCQKRIANVSPAVKNSNCSFP